MGYSRLSGATGEEPAHVGGELGRAARPDDVGRGTTLGGQAGQPEGHVELGVAHGGKVPVEEDGTAGAEAEVVAAHVAMDEIVAGQWGGGGGPAQNGHGLFEPAGVAQSEVQEGGRVG